MKLDARVDPISSMPTAKRTYESAVERTPKYPIKIHSFVVQLLSHGASEITKGFN